MVALLSSTRNQDTFPIQMQISLHFSRISLEGFPHQCLRSFFKDWTEGSCSITLDGLFLKWEDSKHRRWDVELLNAVNGFRVADLTG